MKYKYLLIVVNKLILMISKAKLIGCNLYGHVRTSPLALRIIDTPEFQRLKQIKQLGLCWTVFPAATHTRYEHSVGTYHLTGKMLEKIREQYPAKQYQIIELGGSFELTQEIAEMIKIAGLCHDIGHGPFSHIFDDVILQNSIHPNKTHEVRSCLILELICKRETNLSDHQISFIKSLINPTEKHRGVLYQIVSNYLNGIDVDKLDYLARDSYNLGLRKGINPCRIIDELIIDENENISYPKHCSSDILDMFYTRYILHKQIYTHKTVIIVEQMIKDIFKCMDPIYKISESIHDMNIFCKFTDSTLFHLVEFGDDYLSKKIYQRFLTRQLYKIIFSTYDVNLLDNIKKFANDDQLKVIVTKIGFINNDKNPFSNVFFYDNREDNKSFTMDNNHISGILSPNFQETRILLICSDNFEDWKNKFVEYSKHHL